jgi:hypothetical protein
MHVDQNIEWNVLGVKRHDNRLGKTVMWSKGLDIALLHFADTTKCLEHCFSAPVTPTSKTNAGRGQ